MQISALQYRGSGDGGGWVGGGGGGGGGGVQENEFCRC